MVCALCESANTRNGTSLSNTRQLGKEKRENFKAVLQICEVIFSVFLFHLLHLTDDIAYKGHCISHDGRSVQIVSDECGLAQDAVRCDPRPCPHCFGQIPAPSSGSACGHSSSSGCGPSPGSTSGDSYPCSRPQKCRHQDLPVQGHQRCRQGGDQGSKAAESLHPRVASDANVGDD